jgi:PAS domain S-box-containing protein
MVSVLASILARHKRAVRLTKADGRGPAKPAYRNICFGAARYGSLRVAEVSRMEIPQIDQLQFRRLLTRAIIVPVIALVAFVGLLLWQLRDMLSAIQLVDHSDQVVAQAQATQKLMLDMETGLRGYLITGEGDFLGPYRAAQSSIRPAFSALKTLVADNPAQTERISQLVPLYDGWQQYAQNVIALHDSGGDYASAVRAREGKQRMDATRALLADFTQAEMNLRDLRSRAAQQSTRIVIGSSIALALVLGAALAVVSRRQLLMLSQSYDRTVALVQERANLLDEQRERLQVTLASIGDGVVVTDVAGRVTLINGVAQSLIGWSASEAAGQPLSTVFTIVNEHTRQPVENPVVKVLQHGAIVGLANHTLLIRRDGAEIPIDDSAAPIRDPQGQMLGVVLVFRDIAEQKQAADAKEQLTRQVETQRQRLNNVIANVPGVVWESWGQPDATNQRIDFVSDYVETMLGYSVDEWLATPNFWLKIVHPDDRERAAEVANETFRSGRPGVNQFRWVRRDGQVLWVETFSAPIVDPSGQAIGMRGVTLDITERKQIEEARTREQERQNLLIETSELLTTTLEYEPALEHLAELLVPRLADWAAVHLLEDGIVRRLAVAHVDPTKAELARSRPDHYPLHPNAQHSVAHVLATGEAELYADVTDDLLVATARDTEHLKLLRALGYGSYICVPLIARGRTLGVITLVTSDSGRHYDASDLAFAEDLAARVAIAVDNARLYRQAQAAVRARDQFLSIASHELKTPLTSLIGYTDLIQRRARRDGAFSERDQRAVRVIGEQSQRLNRLVTALLDLSRIQNGQLSIDRGVVELNSLAQRLIQELAQAQPHEAERIVFDGAPEPLVLQGDELRLEQVIQNLIQNALKYSPAGGPVVIRLGRSDDQASISVRDKGIGIPAASLHNLFQRFYRAPNVETHQITGMGVGLFVVREIVQLHGGEISVESEEGVGSTFTVRLPLHHDGEMPAAREQDGTAEGR